MVFEVIKTCTENLSRANLHRVSFHKSRINTECHIVVKSTAYFDFLLLFLAPIYLIFEDAENGNLLDYLQQNHMKDDNNSMQTVCTLSKVEKLRIALDVVRGMKHIAEKKVGS